MYTFENLVNDSSARGKQVKGGETAVNYREVWNAFVSYVAFCMDQRRGVNLPSLCKIGWQIEKKGGQKDVYRPFFQFSDAFCRAYLTEEAKRKNQVPMSGELCHCEDFNFSKAAIKFSQSLTKDQLFSGLRTLVGRLGEVISGAGDAVEIVCGNIGKLTSPSGGDPCFRFTAELYSQEGLEPPGGAPSAVSLQAPSFSRDAPIEALGLGVSGKGATNRQAPSNQLSSSAPAPVSSLPPVYEEEQNDYFNDDSASRRSPMSGGSTPQGRAPVLTNQQFKREVAYKESMDRHIGAMEARAQEAVSERETWSDHVQNCLEQERDEIQEKRERNQYNLHFLRHQMALGEHKRKEQRKDDIVSASAHDFPKFTEPVADEMKDFIQGQQARMRTDLDEQVRTNNTLRNLAKNRERNLEINQLQANKQEMSMLRNAERAKKAYDREALATAWNSEIRMKNIWKAIESHNKVGSAAGSQPPQVMGLSDDGFSTSGGRLKTGGSCASAGRLMTGSSRRVPLGASSSMGRLGTGRVSNA